MTKYAFSHLNYYTVIIHRYYSACHVFVICIIHAATTCKSIAPDYDSYFHLGLFTRGQC